MKVKKILASMLAFVMIVSTMGLTAFAQVKAISSADELIEAAKNGGSYELTGDITIPGDAEVVTVAEGVSFELNLNEYTIKRDNADNQTKGSVIESYGKSLKLTNGTIRTDVNRSYVINIYGGDVELDVDIVAGQEAHGGLAIGNGANVTISGGSILIDRDMTRVNSCHTIYTYGNSTVTIKDGQFTSGGYDGSLIYQVNGKVDVEGGTFATTGNTYGPASSAGEMNIKDGTFSCTLLGWGGDIAVSGGTYTTPAAQNSAKQYINAGEAYIDSATGALVKYTVSVDGKGYNSFEEAFAAIKENSVIDLLGNTYDLPEVNSLKITKNVTIQNGTIDIDKGTWNGNSIIEVYGGTAEAPVVLTMIDVDVTGDSYSSAFGVIYAHSNGKVVLDGCDFTLSNEKFSGGGVLKGNGINVSAFDVKDCTFNLENPNRVIANATTNLDGVTIDAKVTDTTLVPGDTNNHALRNLVGTIVNSTITVDGFESGIKNDAGNLTVGKDTTLTLKNSTDNDIYLDKNFDITTIDNAVVNYDAENSTIKEGSLVVPAVATIGKNGYATIDDVIAAAKDGDTVKLAAGEFGGGIRFSANITLEGTLGENGEHLTVVKDSIQGTAGGYYDYAIKMNDGALKNIEIRDCWKAFITESLGDFTFDNVKIVRAMYGIHIAEAKPNHTVTIKNCDIDTKWANSFAGGIGTLIVENNTFRANNAYYEESGGNGINTYSKNTQIRNNKFVENARILLRTEDVAKNVVIEDNYFDDLSKVFEGGNGYAYGGYLPANGFFPVYTDESMTELSDISFVEEKNIASSKVKITTLFKEVKNEELTQKVVYSVNAASQIPEAVELADGEEVEYIDISILRNGKAHTTTNFHEVEVTLGNAVNGDVKVKHWNGTAWEDVDSTTNENVVTFDTNTFSPFAFIYNAGTLTDNDRAESVTASLEKVADNEYNVVLTGDNDKVINRFMSAEFDIDFTKTEGSLAASVERVGNVNIVYPEFNQDSDLYEFNLNGAQADITGKKIVVAKVVLTGYGKGELKLVAADGSMVNTEKGEGNNHVTTFTLTDGSFTIDTEAKAIELTAPTQTLKINVAFDNAISANAAAYQDMKITIFGGDLKEDIVFDLGDGAEWNNGVYTVKTDLVQNNLYNVVITGAGYRTARYTVKMDDNKVLNFWNDLKTVEEIVDVTNTKSAMKSNFLAGDIVMDEDINIYDLSAVVSYFGKTAPNTTAAWDYVKYDLDRNGKIDSKDVAYVLVSWDD